ncbi:unnamed protein product [Lactuca virosa]|uniref:DUF641 domain-containing protein n=1 Tax=Lactuca virosa TaxID=75947 RepID=A0AAU9P3M9_9ASTR|nr:unnamed protein product [Lactuca virosa]
MGSVNRSTVTPRKSRLARTFAKFFNEEDEKFQENAAMDAFIAKVFATISSVKATYAQDAQSPHDADGIQSADQIVVTELKRLSKFKQS